MYGIVKLLHFEESEQKSNSLFFNMKKLFRQTLSVNVNSSNVVVNILIEKGRQYSENTPLVLTPNDSEDIGLAKLARRYLSSFPLLTRSSNIWETRCSSGDHILCTILYV